MDRLLQDLRYAIHRLFATPAFTLAAVATLAIGVGATTAIFSTVNATLLKPLPYTHPEELVALRTAYTDGRVTTGLVAASEVMRIGSSNISVSRAVAVSSAAFDATILRDNGTPVHAVGNAVSEGFFDLFGLPMTLGAPFTHEQHVPIKQGAGPPPPPVIIVSHRAWTEWFGSDPAIVGKTVRFNEIPPTVVVGVGPRDLDFPHDTDFWLNLRSDPQDVGHGLAGVVRMKPGTTIERLRSELAVVMAGLARDFPLSDEGRVFLAQPLVASIVGDLGPTLLIVFGATALLLLLACVNVTNLLLGRGAARSREIAVRAALGASHGRIVRQLLTESFVVTALGTAAGLGLAYTGVRLLQTLGASKLPRLDSVPFDGAVLAFAIVVLVACGLMLGIAPAVRLARTDLKTLMNESGRTSSGGPATARMMSAMTVAEVALAVVLVAGAGWLVESFSKLRSTDPGFKTVGRLLVDVRPNGQRVRGPDQALAWTQTLFDRLRAIPGVSGVGSTLSYPLRGSLDGSVFVQFQGDAFDPARPTGARQRLVSPGFFDAMGIPLAMGRDFTTSDRRDSAAVAIVNREFVKRYLPGKDPMRMAFAWGYPNIDTRTFYTIVGVVGDVRYRSIAEDPEPSFYLPQGRFPFARQTVVIATKLADAAPLSSSIRNEITSMEPDLAVEVETASHFVASTLTRQQLGMTLMLLFGATALVLAAVGIYGVIAYASSERLAEIATRLALGATPGDMFWLMMRHGQWLTIVGVMVGVAGAYAAGRAVSSLVFGVRAADAVVLATATIVVVALTSIATAIPAHLASRTDPIRALRSE